MRLLVGAVLIFGSFTNEASELQGWDVDRFQQIADNPGQPWVDHEVEYPPASVLAIELVSADSLPASHDRLALLSLFIDVGIAVAIRLGQSLKASSYYLLLGTPLLPGGYLRFDLWATALALAAFFALIANRKTLFGLLCAAGAMLKLWPALLIVAAVSSRRFAAAGVAVTAGLLTTVLWLALYKFQALEQVLSLRGAEGWHVESLPGSLIALFSEQSSGLELNAFRIGTMHPAITASGRALALFAMAALVHAQIRQINPSPTKADKVRNASLIMLGAVAALIVTSPLVSPQFMFWLTPWAALLFDSERRVAYLSLAISTTTGVTLAVFGPDGVDQTLPALLLLLRNLALGYLVFACWRALKQNETFSEVQERPTMAN